MSTWESGRSLWHSACAQGGPLAGGTVAAVSPKPMYHSSWCGPEDTLVLRTLCSTLSWPAWTPSATQLGSSLAAQAPCTHLQGPRRLTLSFRLRPMSRAHLRTALQKALGKREVPASPREEISVEVSPGRLLFICFLPLFPEVPQQGAQGTWSPWPLLGLGAVSHRDRGPRPGLTGFLTRPHPHVPQSLS